jgi:NAD(P)-dependent dehydrogenase (short-subunit alcohol dehydrogenase family)
MERWQHAIVVGASSGIGAEVARQAAADGCRVALLARREDELRRLADEINAQAGERRAVFFAHDVTQYDEVPALFQEVCRSLGGLDAIIYAAGVMPRVAPDEYTFANDRTVVEVNLLGAIAWLNEAAQRFAQARAGVICAISSVAGDRGRSGNPVYCASKAGLDTYLEALRNRLGRLGVAVVTVKPGPVDTPMTRGLDRLPMLTAPKTAARLILGAAHRRRNVAYIPRQWRPIMWVVRSVPSWLFQRMKV